MEFSAESEVLLGVISTRSWLGVCGFLEVEKRHKSVEEREGPPLTSLLN